MTDTPRDDIRTYRLDPAAFLPLAKRRLYKRLPWLALALGAGVLVQYAALSRTQEEGTFNTLPLLIPIVVAAAGFGVFRAHSRLEQGLPIWESYRLTISENVLRRVVSNQTAVEVLRSEVTAITNIPEGLRVLTADRHRVIFVPAQLLDFTELRERLSSWRALEAPKLARTRALSVGWSSLLLGSWLATGLLPDLTWAMLAGALLLIAGAFGIREMLKTQGFDNQVKATTIRGLVFLMLAPFARLALHFVFHVDLPWSR